MEIVSLNLKPDSRVSTDSSVVRLFVEYNLLDLPSEETPLSLPKPLPGHSIYYNYSHGTHRPLNTHRHTHNIHTTQNTAFILTKSEDECDLGLVNIIHSIFMHLSYYRPNI